MSKPHKSKYAIVYHVCGMHKLQRYKEAGHINPPVRAWCNISEAERFSKQTGRPIILRLKFENDKMKVLYGHRGKARYIETAYDISKLLGSS